MCFSTPTFAPSRAQPRLRASFTTSRPVAPAAVAQGAVELLLVGRDAGPVDLHEHDLAQWERIIDAMIRIMCDRQIYTDLAQLRNGIEQLGPEAYEKYSYYERWAASAARQCLATGIVSEDELKEKMNELRARGAGE